MIQTLLKLELHLTVTVFLHIYVCHLLEKALPFFLYIFCDFPKVSQYSMASHFTITMEWRYLLYYISF